MLWNYCDGSEVCGIVRASILSRQSLASFSFRVWAASAITVRAVIVLRTIISEIYSRKSCRRAREIKNNIQNVRTLEHHLRRVSTRCATKFFQVVGWLCILLTKFPISFKASVRWRESRARVHLCRRRRRRLREEGARRTT